MTIDDQLRVIARHADQHQQVITAREIIQRASRQDIGPFTTRSEFNDRQKVLDHIPVGFTEEDATMIDLDTPSSTDEPRRGPNRAMLAGVLAAAAVVAVVFVASSDVDVVTPADEPSATVPATLFPRVQDGHSVRYVPGTYFVDEVSGTPTARISFTIGAGWRDMTPGLEILQSDIGGIAFSRADRVFSDACHWSTGAAGGPPARHGDDGYYPGPVATLDGLVAALTQQGGWVDVTAPSDISVDGYAGKAFQRTAPADLSDCSTRPPNFSPYGNAATYPQIPVLRSWQNELSGGDNYEPGEVETLWILDIDGTVVIINTRLWPSATTGARLSPQARALAGPPAAARADSAAVFNSIHIEHA